MPRENDFVLLPVPFLPLSIENPNVYVSPEIKKNFENEKIN